MSKAFKVGDLVRQAKLWPYRGDDDVYEITATGTHGYLYSLVNKGKSTMIFIAEAEDIVKLSVIECILEGLKDEEKVED